MSDSKKGIDWMYQSAASKAEQKKDEEESYLLGKEYNPKLVKTGDLAVGQEATVGISRIVDNVGTADGFSHHGKNEAFLLKHEDPMFMVDQTRKEKENELRKKKQLIDKVSSTYEDRKSSSNRRSSRRKDRRERSLSPSSRDEERRRRRKNKDKKHKKRRHRSYSTDSDDSKYRRRRRRKHGEKGGDHDESRSRSPSPNKESRRSKKRSRRQRSTSYDRYERTSKRDEHLNENYMTNNGHPKPNREGFGLISGKSPKNNEYNSDSLGPDQALLEKKRQEQEDARNWYKRRGRNDKSKMTDGERRAALNAMQCDGNDRAARLSKASAAEKVDLHDEEIHRRMKEGSKDMSSFVQELVVKTHGINGQNAPTLSKQIQQNRNNIQRSSDDNFL